MFLWAWFSIIACCAFWIAVTLVLGKEFYWQPDGWGFQQRKLTTKAEDAEEVKTSDKANDETDSAKANEEGGEELQAESTTEFFCASAIRSVGREDLDESAPMATSKQDAADSVDGAEEQAPLLSSTQPDQAGPEEAEMPPSRPADQVSADGSESEEEESAAIEEAEEAELSAEEVEARLKRALAKKESGNECFKAGALEEACALYNEALNVCPTVKGDTASVIFTNLAHTLNRREMYAEGFEAAEAAIELDKNNGKAYLRKYEAASALDKIHDAYNALKLALDLRPELRREFGGHLAKLKHRSETKLEEEKAEMLGKLKEFGSWALGKVGMSIDDFKMVQDPATGSYNIQYNPTQQQPPAAQAPPQPSL